MGYEILPLTKLIEHFERLPGVGKKSAQRLAFYVLNMPKEKAEDFAASILDAREKIHYCSVCQNITDQQDLFPLPGSQSGSFDSLCGRGSPGCAGF